MKEEIEKILEQVEVDISEIDLYGYDTKVSHPNK